MKDSIVWFIDFRDYTEQWAISAKLKQLNDWVNGSRPFGNKYNVILVPSKENKFCILKDAEEFKEDFDGDYEKWLCGITNKLTHCLTVDIPLQKS